MEGTDLWKISESLYCPFSLRLAAEIHGLCELIDLVTWRIHQWFYSRSLFHEMTQDSDHFVAQLPRTKCFPEARKESDG